MKRVLVAGVLAVVLTGCGSSSPRDELVCLDIAKSVVTDPKSMQVNNVKRSEGKGSIEDIKAHLGERYSGEIPQGTQRLIKLYEDQGVDVLLTYITLDITHEAGAGKARDEVLCGYISYDGKTELTSISVGRSSIGRDKLFNFFMRAGRPEHLDSMYRIK